MNYHVQSGNKSNKNINDFIWKMKLMNGKGTHTKKKRALIAIKLQFQRISIGFACSRGFRFL